MRNALKVVVLSLAFAGVVGAQNNLHVATGDLSIPFGSVPGKVITVGDYLIFIDQDHPESSFVLERAHFFLSLFGYVFLIQLPLNIL